MRFLRPTLLFAILWIGPGVASAITIATVPIGDVGNPNDPATGSLYGGVNYAYRIGTYEVTVAQYATFLNAVGTNDTHGLFNTNMADDLRIAGIVRNGSPGNYSYGVVGSPNHPIARITFGDAARFTNWLSNGQPTGEQNANTTEDGAYTLAAATNDFGYAHVLRNANAKWFIPTENEWYKAAFYQPQPKGGDVDGYWAYPMKTNSVPYSDQAPGATPDNTRVGNFYNDDGLPNGYDDGRAVTGSTDFSDSENYLTDVGAYVLSPSYYGTFDQGGNVWEWTEATIDFSSRELRGSSWYSGARELASSYRYGSPAGPEEQDSFTGFRVASYPAAVGDFNADGVVDMADYVVWRGSNGSVADYNLWRANFGLRASTSGAGSALSTSVPEPSAIAMLAIGAMGFTHRRRRPTSHNRV